MATILGSVLMCHAPIVIPAIAGGRAAECAATTAAMEQAAAWITGTGASRLLVITPHAERAVDRFLVTGGRRHTGSFSRFGFPDIRVTMDADTAFHEAVAGAGPEAPVQATPAVSLDHGALVPLWFVARAGYTGRLSVMALPDGGDPGLYRRCGEWIAETVAALDEPLVILASGDMSHRLQEDAPCGYHPDGPAFDRYFSAAIRAGEYEQALQDDENVRMNAAEDVVESVAVALAATGYSRAGRQFLTYEGPFGVGYMEAILNQAGPP